MHYSQAEQRNLLVDKEESPVSLPHVLQGLFEASSVTCLEPSMAINLHN